MEPLLISGHFNNCYFIVVFLVAAVTSFSFGKSVRPFQVSSLYCDGSESILLDCFYYNTQSCSYSYDAGVSCEGQYYNYLLL